MYFWRRRAYCWYGFDDCNNSSPSIEDRLLICRQGADLARKVSHHDRVADQVPPCIEILVCKTGLQSL